MKRFLILALVSFAGCTTSTPPPLSATDRAARVVFLSLEHLETRTSLSSADLYFRNFPSGVIAQSVVANVAPGVRVEDRNGVAVDASVELIGSHYGDGFRVSWRRGMPAGWYRIVIPTRELPAFINAKAWNQTEDEGSVWFRIGSQPVVRSVVRLRGETSTFFEIHFSESMRAETSNLDELVRLFDGETRLRCAGVVALGANEPVDLTRHFRSFSLECEGANASATRVEVDRFRTPEGDPVADIEGGVARFAIDWQTAVPLEGGFSEQWYESRLPR